MPTLTPTLTPTLRTVSSLEVSGRSTRSPSAMGPGSGAGRSLVRSGSSLGWNQELYQRLRLSLGLGLRRQVFLVVCDDLPLRDRLAGRLAQELPTPQLATLRLESHQTEMATAIAALSAATVQVLGIEQLTRQAARLQRHFLAELESLAEHWATAELSLLLWVPRPWLYTIRESAPQFWACCTGTFEFEGQPTVVVNSLGGLSGSSGVLVDRRGRPAGPQPVVRDRPRPARPVMEPQSGESSPSELLPKPSEPTALDRWVMEATTARARAAEPGLTAELAQAALERAALAYQRAIEWAQTHGESDVLRSLYYDLGGVYSDLVRWAEPATAWEQAVQAYRAAIGDGSGGDRAWRVAARNNLGTALWSWARYGESIARLQEAIAVYRAGLGDYQDPTTAAPETLDGGDRLPPDSLYGTLQANLGTAYLHLAQADPQDRWLLLAASAFEAALPYRRVGDRPAAYAATQNNLGTTYWQLGRQLQPLDPQRRRDCWQRAALAYDRALSIDPAIPVGFDRAAAAGQLAWICLQLGTDAYAPPTAADRATQLDRALAAYLRLLDGNPTDPAKRDRALGGIIATIRAIYQHLGIEGQSRALSSIPGQWLPDVIDRLAR